MLQPRRFPLSALLALAAALTFAPGAGHTDPGHGDLQDDGKFDVGDALLCLRIVRGDLIPTAQQENRSDVAPVNYGPGEPPTVDAGDVLLMLRAVRGDDVDADGLDTEGENVLGSSPFLDDTDSDGHLDPSDPDALVYSAPGIPGSLRVVDGAGEVTLTFATPSGEVDFYRIHRLDDEGNYTFQEVDGDATSFVDTDVVPGAVYFYWIQAVNSRGQEAAFVDCDISDPGNPALWLTGGVGPVSNPWFTATGTDGQIDLDWEQSGNPQVTGYKIWLASAPVPLGDTLGLALEATVNGAGNTSHSVTGLSAGTYYVRITAFTASAESRLDTARQRPAVVQ